MPYELIVRKAAEHSRVSFDVLDPVEPETTQGERAIAVNVIAVSEEKMRKRALVSTHGVTGYGTFEVQCDEGTPLVGTTPRPRPSRTSPSAWRSAHSLTSRSTPRQQG